MGTRLTLKRCEVVSQFGHSALHPQIHELSYHYLLIDLTHVIPIPAPFNQIDSHLLSLYQDLEVLW